MSMEKRGVVGDEAEAPVTKVASDKACQPGCTPPCGDDTASKIAEQAAKTKDTVLPA